MPAPRTPVGAPIWNDLATTDVPAAVSFYTALFGWEHTDYGEDFGHYGTFTKNGAQVAGVGPTMEPGAPVAWMVHLHAADAEATARAVVEAGGQVVAPVMVVPEQGTMAVVADPAGTVFALWQPGGHSGFGVVAEPGAPAWHELHTSDYDRAVPFYRDAVGWTPATMSDDAQFRYTTDTVDGQPLAGIYDASGDTDGALAQWLVYFAADDTDAAVARAVELGATVNRPAVDSPFGRFAHLSDPTGARFVVIDMNQE